MVPGRSASVRTENEPAGSDGAAEAAGAAHTCAPAAAHRGWPRSSRTAARAGRRTQTCSRPRGRRRAPSSRCPRPAASGHVHTHAAQQPHMHLHHILAVCDVLVVSRPSALTLLMDWLPMRNSSSVRTGGPPVCCTWNSASGSSPASRK